jgi:PhnB protein
MNAQTYLYFAGNAAEALERYSAALGAEVLFVMRYKDGPRELAPPGAAEQIYHATVRLGDTLINLSDDPRSERGSFGGFALLLHADSDAEADRLFARLSGRGTVQLAMMTVPWASRYGIVRDEFGIVWKIQAGGAAKS